MHFFNNNTTLHLQQGTIALHYMFDEEEQKLLQYALSKARKDYHNNCNVYSVSAFDPAFDLELRKLVLFYSFDFEAIALHLYFKFPQYSSRLKPQAVAYRWYQLTLEQKEEEKGKQQQIMAMEKVREEKKEAKDEEMTVDEQERGLVEHGDKKMQFEAAMMVASTLDEEEQEGFMIYSPKFIIDSEFKLQRTPSQTNHLLALLQNDLAFEFGPFEPPQTAPFDYNLYQPQSLPSEQKAEAEQQEYLDDDWQAYESD